MTMRKVFVLLFFLFSYGNASLAAIARSAETTVDVEGERQVNYVVLFIIPVMICSPKAILVKNHFLDNERLNLIRTHQIRSPFQVHDEQVPIVKIIQGNRVPEARLPLDDV